MDSQLDSQRLADAAYALPSYGLPRLVLFPGSLRQRWSESRWLPAYRWTARLWRFFVRVRYVLYPGLTRIRTSGDSPHLIPNFSLLTFSSLADHLASTQGAGFRMVVRIGTADARQKLTVLMHDAKGQLCRVAKVGFLPLARTMVDREATALRALPAGVGPRYLSSGNITTENTKDTESDGRIVVFEPVQGRGLPAKLPKSPSDRSWRDLDAFLARLFITMESTKDTEAPPTLPTPGPFRDFGVFRGVSSLYPASHHPSLTRLASAHPDAPTWIAALSGREWPVVIEHGDFAPWNLLRTPAGLQAIDWEDARLDGFPGVDLVHYMIQTGALVHGWSPERIRRYSEQRLRDAGFQECEAAAVVRLAALQDNLVTAPGEQVKLQRIRSLLVGVSS